MPLNDFVCKCGNIQEELHLSILNVPKTVKCNKCGGRAEKQIGLSSTHFAPYLFSDSGYAGYEERKNFVDRLDKNDLGGAHREAMRKGLPPNRILESFKGKKIASC